MWERHNFEFLSAEADTGTIVQISTPVFGYIHSIGWSGDTGLGSVFVQQVPRKGDTGEADTGAAFIVLNRAITNPEQIWLPRLVTTLPAGTDTGHQDRDRFACAGERLRVRKVGGSRGRLYVWIKGD